MKRRIAKARVLLGLSAFGVCSAVPTLALADGSEIVTGIAPASPSPPTDSSTHASPAGPTDSSTQPPSSRLDTRVAALVLGGVAVVGAGAGIAFGVLALNDKSSFDHDPTTHAADSANENAVLSDVCFGGALVAAVTSIVLLARSSGLPPASTAGLHEKSALSLTISPMITLRGGGAGAALLF